VEARPPRLPALRVAVLQNIVAPTRHALFSALAERVDLTVLFMARTEASRGWQGREALEYRHEFLRGVHLPLRGRGDVEALHLNPGVVQSLVRGRYDVVVSGYLAPSAWLALAATRATGAKMLLWYGSAWRGDDVRARLAAPLKRTFVKATDGFLAYGETARARLVEQGVDPRRAWVATNTTDVAAFAAVPRAPRGRPTALWVGRFVPRKHAARALDLFAGLAQEVPDLRVVFVGDGRERPAVEAAARARGIDAEFVGEQAYGRLPEWYAQADVLVTLAEREPWGLVVNEALAAGVPVLATPGVIAACELVPPGAGIVSDDPAALAAEARRLLLDEGALAAAREAARSVLPRMTPAVWADQVAAAARAVVADLPA
jgi:glycosyltransferase involved in cell wall biosynthesis